MVKMIIITCEALQSTEVKCKPEKEPLPPIPEIILKEMDTTISPLKIQRNNSSDSIAEENKVKTKMIFKEIGTVPNI